MLTSRFEGAATQVHPASLYRMRTVGKESSEIIGPLAQSVRKRGRSTAGDESGSRISDRGTILYEVSRLKGARTQAGTYMSCLRGSGTHWNPFDLAIFIKYRSKLAAVGGGAETTCKTFFET